MPKLRAEIIIQEVEDVSKFLKQKKIKITEQIYELVIMIRGREKNWMKFKS